MTFEEATRLLDSEERDLNLQCLAAVYERRIQQYAEDDTETESVSQRQLLRQFNDVLARIRATGPIALTKDEKEMARQLIVYHSGESVSEYERWCHRKDPGYSVRGGMQGTAARVLARNAISPSPRGWKFLEERMIPLIARTLVIARREAPAAQTTLEATSRFIVDLTIQEFQGTIRTPTGTRPA